jgi:hypothetical protein
MWRIKTLTDEFGVYGFGWYYEVTKQWFEAGANEEKACFTNINLYVKIGDEWSKPIFGNGGSMFISNESRGLYTDDEAIKKSLTDAIGVAAKHLGLAGDVYFEKDSSKYDAKSVDQSQPAKTFTPNKPSDGGDFVSKAVGEMMKCKSMDEVTACWNKFPTLNKTQSFIDACKEVQVIIKTPAA